MIILNVFPLRKSAVIVAFSIQQRVHIKVRLRKTRLCKAHRKGPRNTVKKAAGCFSFTLLPWLFRTDHPLCKQQVERTFGDATNEILS